MSDDAWGWYEQQLNLARTEVAALRARADQGAAEIAQLRQELVGSVKAETHAFAVRKAEEYLTELQALRDAQARLLTLVQTLKNYQETSEREMRREATRGNASEARVRAAEACVLNVCITELDAVLQRDPGSRSRLTQEKGRMTWI